MDTDDSFQDIWTVAVHEYETQTERKLDRDPTFKKFRTLDELDDYVRRSEEGFSSFREEHGKLYSRMAKCFKPLVPILEVVKSGIGSTPYAPAAIAFGAAAYLLQACEKVTTCYDAVEELFGQIENVTTRLREYEHSSMETSLKLKMADILAYILEIMGKTEKIVRRKRVKQWARSLFLHDDEVSPSLIKLRKFAEEELGLVMALTYARAGDILDATGQLKSATAELQRTADNNMKLANDILRNQQSERLRAFDAEDERRIADALKSNAYDAIAKKHRQNMEALTKGTGVWIKDDPMFQAWEEEKAPVLWVFGKPGVGKTMLATRTIEVLRSDFPQHPDIPSLTSVSYLYFKDDVPDLRDCTQMWKAIAAQIVQTNDRFKKHVLAVTKNEGVFSSCRRAWELLFLDFFTESKSTQGQTSLAFIIVDGLDEAPESQRVQFLVCLSELTKRVTETTRCRIQIVIFARHDVRADPGFDKIGTYQSGRIYVTPDRNKKDIGAFIKQHISEVQVLKNLKRMDPRAFRSLAKHISLTVQSRAQGMFLWARLIFDQLRKLPSPEAVRASLAQAPDGLDEMLHHVFQRFDHEVETRQAYLSDLLAWVQCTYRPLYLSELFVLLFLTADQKCVTLKEDLQSRYSSIFDITGPGGEELEDDPAGPDEGSEEKTRDLEDHDFDFLDDVDTDGVESIDSASETLGDEPAVAHSSEVQEIRDVDSSTNMISDLWRTSTVTFSHARIRDYLTSEYNPQTRRWDDCSLFTHDLNETKQRMFGACVKVLRTDITNVYDVHSLTWYARRYWVRHLLDIDPGEVGSKLSVNTARLLAGIFNDGKCFLKSSYGIIDDFTATWFETNRYIKVARKLITDHIEHLDECHHAWAQRVKVSSRALFEALVSECATTWLTKTGFDDPAYLDKSEFESWVLYAFNSLTDDGVDENEPPVFYYGGSIPLADIEAIANLVSLPKNEHWYVGVAWIMMEAKEPAHTQKAIQYFNKARELADGAWVALEGLAICHGDSALYQEAVDLMCEAMRQLPQTKEYEGIAFYLRSNMGTWQRKLGDLEEALRVTQVAYEESREYAYPTGMVSDHRTRLAIGNYIGTMYDMHKFDDLIEVLHDLDARPTFDSDRSLWIAYLRWQYDDSYDIDIFGKLAAITRSVGSERTAPLIRSSVERAVPLQPGVFSYGGNLWLIRQCISWLFELPGEQDYAARLCQKAIEVIDQSDETTQQKSWWYRDQMAATLSTYYLRTAIKLKSKGEDYSTTIAQLGKLAYHHQGSKKYVRASYPALLMGEWLHDHTDTSDEEWMAYFKPSVKRALHLLSDNDPWNDQSAYAQLGQALLCANDITNSRVALGITMKPLQVLNDGHGTISADASSNDKDDAPTEGEAAMDVEAATVDKAETDVEAAIQSLSLGDKDVHVKESTSEEPNVADAEVEGSANELDDEDEDEEVEEEYEEPDNFKYAGFGQMWDCDGCVDTRNKATDPYKELHFCRICVDECFCEKCIILLRDGQLDSYTSCSGKHEHVQMFPASQEARDMTEALLEKRFEVQQDWLNGLWKIWGDGDARPEDYQEEED